MPPATPTLQHGSLALHILAATALGLMAGFFGTYSANVAPALATLDGPSYAAVQSELNRQVRHALFFACFFEPVPACALALAGARRAWTQPWWWLLAAAGLAYALGIVVFTRQVNLPLNHATEGWNPGQLPTDWATVRDRWNAANLWRSACSLACYAAALAALVLRLRAPAARPA